MKKKPRRLREVYLVSKTKFHSDATEEELCRELGTNDLNTDDGHRITQCKIRQELCFSVVIFASGVEINI
jgi:hypothetical protein